MQERKHELMSLEKAKKYTGRNFAIKQKRIDKKKHDMINKNKHLWQNRRKSATQSYRACEMAASCIDM